ncbi:universal stress protein [Roseovarius sp. MBR-154]
MIRPKSTRPENAAGEFPPDSRHDPAAGDKADLIIMGAHSHSRSRQLLFGSVTRAILKDTTVPVLLSR